MVGYYRSFIPDFPGIVTPLFNTLFSKSLTIKNYFNARNPTDSRYFERTTLSVPDASISKLQQTFTIHPGN